MIDISKLRYYLYLVTGSGKTYKITELQQGISWEENQGELAVRLQIILKNQIYEGKKISTMAALGAKLAVFSDWGSGEQEVFRGDIWNWNDRNSLKKELNLTAYDNLIRIQKSKDYRYYSAGTSSKTIILDIFHDWGIPVGIYNGPNVPMGKKIFKGDTLGDMVTEVLDDAKKKGAGKFVVRGNKGKVDILPRGSNSLIYYFGKNNTIMTDDKMDIENLVTRVKIIGAENKDGKSPVAAIVDGKTEFGIIQDIVSRSQDDNLDVAKSSAKDILNDKGKPKRVTKLEAPDIPFLRAGDKIHTNVDNLNGYY